jgi:hypothetical protein
MMPLPVHPFGGLARHEGALEHAAVDRDSRVVAAQPPTPRFLSTTGHEEPGRKPGGPPPKAKVPVVTPVAPPGSDVRPGSPLKAYKRETCPKISTPRPQGLRRPLVDHEVDRVAVYA